MSGSREGLSKEPERLSSHPVPCLNQAVAGEPCRAGGRDCGTEEPREIRRLREALGRPLESIRALLPWVPSPRACPSPRPGKLSPGLNPAFASVCCPRPSSRSPSLCRPQAGLCGLALAQGPCQEGLTSFCLQLGLAPQGSGPPLATVQRWSWHECHILHFQRKWLW